MACLAAIPVIRATPEARTSGESPFPARGIVMATSGTPIDRQSSARAPRIASESDQPAARIFSLAASRRRK